MNCPHRWHVDPPPGGLLCPDCGGETSAPQPRVMEPSGCEHDWAPESGNGDVVRDWVCRKCSDIKYATAPQPEEPSGFGKTLRKIWDSGVFDDEPQELSAACMKCGQVIGRMGLDPHECPAPTITYAITPTEIEAGKAEMCFHRCHGSGPRWIPANACPACKGDA